MPRRSSRTADCFEVRVKVHVSFRIVRTGVCVLTRTGPGASF